MIDDELGHVQPEVFKKMFFTYFKGEPYAHHVYEKLAPVVSEYYFEGKKIGAGDARANEQNKVVVLQKLTQFIDMFNFYPIKVHKVRYKNDSNELTYVMNSGTQGTKNDLGEYVHRKEIIRTEEELHMRKLLTLVSDKIRERFTTIKECFRFLDTNHSQSISINEFA